ncbi:3-keto-disaccharide hydrolase [Niveispirillum sp. KHB5.9]|uniref:3-keto-disaccharide hydrolase n=1 Tax=Niveispirillum sp. KHB5.9 TaxID=3400269 RepID=UPI003A881FC3
MRWIGLGLAALLLLAGTGIGAGAVEVDRKLEAILAGDPVYKAQRLTLTDIPSPTGPAVSLLNGKDLSDWDIWLGYADPSITYTNKTEKPYGARPGGDPMFTMVTLEGEPTMRVDGATWGSIVHRGTFGNYHLRLEFKWSGKRHVPRLDLPENNGLLYHSFGPAGGVYGTWMPAVEFEIMRGSTGMVVPVGTMVKPVTDAARDRSLIDPQRRYMAGGRAVTVEAPAWNVEAAIDAERPVGQWNVLDLYVLDDRAIHVVNGVPVMELRNLSVLGPDGKRTPLTSGHIQFQSEGAETFFRRISLEPIDRLPRIVVK